MRTIGSTVEGNTLVEMTPIEILAFSQLASVAEGHILAYPFQSQHKQAFGDMAPLFEAVRQWIENTEAVNRLQNVVNESRDVLGVPVKEDKNGCSSD